MQIYWTLKSIPELSGLPSEERMRVWRAAYWKTKRHWQFWAGLVGLGLCAGISTHIGGVIGAGVGGFVGAFIFSQVSCTWRVHISVPFSHLSMLPDGDLSH